MFFSLVLAYLALSPETAHELQIQRARSAVAISAWLVGHGKAVAPPTPSPTPDLVATCTCGGTQKSGDGIGPCPCVANGKACKCKTTITPPAAPVVKPTVVATKPLKRYLLDFSMDGCGPCKLHQERDFPPLKAAGWVISKAVDAHIRLINTSRDNDPWIEKLGINSVPQIVCIEDGLLVGRLYSQQITSPKAITDLYYSKQVPQPIVPRRAYNASLIHREWPGNLQHHLRADHGRELPATVDISKMTQVELEALHDRLHQSRVAQGIEAAPGQTTHTRQRRRTRIR